MYASTDAVDEYVLSTSMYTGTDYKTSSSELKKTTKVVLNLVEPYINTYRSIKTDRYYTSIELVKELEKRKLYTTGTVMSNRINKDIRWNAKEGRDKKRGEFVHHMYKYKNEKGKELSMGLVIWKDKKPVYVLTTEYDTGETDMCIRRSKGGLLNIIRPISVARYNEYMGGVDVSDQKRLFCESRVHGLSRWWIRVFIYYIDVGTVNSMVIFRSAYYNNSKKAEAQNLREFKMAWINAYCGTRIQSITSSTIGLLPMCYLVNMNRRNRCGWCAAVDGVRMDTPIACSHCNNGKGPVYFCNPQMRSCFFMAHKCEETRQHIIDYEVVVKRKRKRSTIVTPNNK